ncbi:hypothetical protein CIL05_20085 [Virgibacillus profundi]|uniref:DnaB/C C-terminal domain-containing protein n=1 Tax=Virgibacillus profundi TaxID=2024555 RepID=A0A2A2I9H0_9BACI|nr:DnaD domain protein [Virgibacillus profundi]PAV27780.1 hypothetical protein CIL05_20085 [Virgibacillus profundi]PXY52002.1 DnaD domain protein [Virgibacillus profundi]
MTTLNFHKDKNFFMDWMVLNHITTGEIVLWHTLMNIGNRLGQRSIFNAPTSTLMRFTGLSKQSVINARKKLLERGFIRYEKGGQNKAPIYEMIPLHQAIGHYSSFTNTEKLTPHLTKDLTQELTPTLTPTSTPNLPIHKVKNTKEKSSSRGEKREVNSLFKSYEENMNKLTPMIEDELQTWTKVFDEEIVVEAIRESVKKGGRTFSYLEKILQNWKQAGLATLAEVETFELEKELEKNKKLIPFRKQTTNEESQEDLFTELLKEDF